jgi:hypothetical protein
MDDFEFFVRAERNRQDIKWGIQNHNPIKWSVILGEEYGEFCKAALENFETKELHEELIHVAAVCKAIYECSIRNRW